MKLFSNENDSWLRIEQTSSDGYSSFQVEVVVDIGHGRFQAKNHDLQWLNVEEFAAELDKFILDRQLIPRLEGTYDSFLELSGSSSSVVVKFAIGDAFCSDETHQYLLSGSFGINQEFLSALAQEFGLLRNDS